MKVRTQIGLFLAILVNSINGFAFEYDQHFINYKGGFLSSLNNCGVNFDASGNYFRGGPATVPVYNDGQRVLFLKEIDGGVLSIFGNGEVHFSPNGMYLAGGGNTLHLATLSNGNVVASQIRSVEKVGNDIVIVHNNPDFSIVGGVVINFEVDTNMVTVIRNALTGTRTIDEYSDTDLLFLGKANDNLYIQRRDSTRLYVVDNLRQAFDRYSGLLISSLPSISEIKKVEEFYGEVLVHGNGRVYQGSGKLLSGVAEKFSQFNGGISNIMVSAQKSFVPIAVGDITTTIIIPVTLSDSVYVATSSGSIWNSVRGYINHPPSPERIGAFNILSVLYNYQSPKTTLLERRQSKKFGSGIFFGSTQSNLDGYAIDFAGRAATVEVEDKGWSGFEYKWRRRSDQTGSLSVSNDGNFIGDNEIRIRAKNSCVALVTLENNTLEPIEFDLGGPSYFDFVTNIFKVNSISEYHRLSCDMIKVPEGLFGC